MRGLMFASGGRPGPRMPAPTVGRMKRADGNEALQLTATEPVNKINKSINKMK